MSPSTQDKLQLKTARSGGGASLGMIVCAAALVLMALLALLVIGGRGKRPIDSDRARSLLVFAAAGLREPLEEAASRYELDHGIHVDIQFGGSNSLLNQLQVDRLSSPDLFLAADQSYAQLALENGLAEETLAVATQRPVVVVRKDSNVKIKTLDDLFVDGLRISMGDPEQASIGRTIRASLIGLSSADENPWERLQRQVERWGVFKPTVNDVAGDVQIGAVDAGIVWDTTVSSPAYKSTLNIIALPEISQRAEQVTLAVLSSSQQPDEARRLARYLTAPESGGQIFYKHGFQPVPARPNVQTHRHSAQSLNPPTTDNCQPAISHHDGLE